MCAVNQVLKIPELHENVFTKLFQMHLLKISVYKWPVMCQTGIKLRL